MSEADQSVAEALRIVHNPDEEAADGLAACIIAIAEATGLDVEDFESQIHSTIEQWEQHGGELFDHIALNVTGPDGELAFYIDADGWKVGDHDELTREADPLWGDVLTDEVREVERALSRPELDALLDEFTAAKQREDRAEMAAKDARSAYKAAKEDADEVAGRLMHSKTTDVVKCPVRLRNGVLVVLHPETHEVLDTREPTDMDRQLTLPDSSAEDEAEGVDRVQIRARLQTIESALAISRGVHAVPPQVEIDAWPSGVCQATTAWLDSIDRGELKPMPVWVTGLRAGQQTIGDDYESSQMPRPEYQIECAYSALIDGTVDEIPFGRVRLDLPGLVAQLKREQTVKGTSQHLTAVLRTVADFGGLPQFKAAVNAAEGPLLRQLHYIAKTKPAPDGMGAEDVRLIVVNGVERAMGVS